MAKKALLVEYCIRTRVIVDVPEDMNDFSQAYKDSENVFDKIAEAARDNIIDNGVEDYLIGDNITEIELDHELPYGELEDEE